MFSYLIADNDKLKQGCSAAPTSIIQPPIPKKAMYKYTHLFGQTLVKQGLIARLTDRHRKSATIGAWGVSLLYSQVNSHRLAL